MAKKGSAKDKDLFHGQGNSTIGLPKHLVGPKKFTDPHTNPGKLLKTKKVANKGWSK